MVLAKVRWRPLKISLSSVLFVVVLLTLAFEIHNLAELYELKHLNAGTFNEIDFIQLQDQYPNNPYPADPLVIRMTDKDDIQKGRSGAQGDGPVHPEPRRSSRPLACYDPSGVRPIIQGQDRKRNQGAAGHSLHRI